MSTTTPLRQRSQVLYRMFNAAGELLYVGITADAGKRIKNHAGGQPWWSEVDTIKLQHYPDRPSVEAAERAAVREENPKFNRLLFDLAPARSIGFTGAHWHRLGVAAEAIGHDRSTLIRQFVRWYLGVPGAQLPPRPDPETFAVAPPPPPTPQEPDTR